MRSLAKLGDFRPIFGTVFRTYSVKSSLMACCEARVAQSVERTTLNRMVVGSSPTLGAILLPLTVTAADLRGS